MKKIKRYYAMYSTNDKQRHRLLLGSYSTRKWNDYSSLIYFEKIYGGKPLLKKIKSIGLENNIEFHSSMVQENMSGHWVSSGWVEANRLNVLSFDLRKYKHRETAAFHVEDFNQNSIDDLLPLDQSIFDAYWRNSKAGFIETVESCNRNYLFKKYVDEKLIGYAILGSTRNFSFLQRFGISKDYQNRGYGSSLLESVVSFAKSKRFVNIRLNTQPNNTAARDLYFKKGFNLTNTNYIIFSSG